MKNLFDIIMVWYQNDWGLYGRRNEFIARTLMKHKAVRSVLHIEPPLDIESLRARLRSDSIDENIHTNLRRINLYNDKGISLFTPHIVKGMPRKEMTEHLQNQLEEVLNICGMDNILLWLYPPHPFVEFILNSLGKRAALIVSDCVDDHRQYAQSDAERFLIEKRYEHIVGASDIVFCVSKTMRNYMARYNPQSFYIPNAIPPELLARKRTGSKPADMAQIDHPIVGYTGALSLRIDADLLRFIAESKPEWNIVLIGTSPNHEVKTLFKLPNVHWLGAMRYNDIHDHILQFDACILPHSISPMTEAMSPLKIYEYLALGKPVIATDVAGVRMFQADIEIAGSKKEFLKAIERSFNTDSLQKQEQRIDRVSNHTWTDRVDEMMRICLTKTESKQSVSEIIDNKQYYSFDRPEVRDCIPDTAKVILDVGCASGNLGAALKRERDCFVIGIEYEPEIANEAKYLLDDVIVGDIEDKVDNLPSNYFDCIVLADVLEHLRSPETVLEKMGHALKETGKIIASIPNVRHWSVLQPLLEGNWKYEDAGILDRTHLRFFTKRSILDLFSHSGYTITDLKHTTLGDTKAFMRPITQVLSIAGVDTKTLTEEANHYQYIVTAEKAKKPQGFTSIILLTYNQLEYTKKCVESIQRYTPEPHEIIFVDNGSTDGTREYLQNLAKESDHIEIILNDRNLGFAAGNNQALQKARGNYILLLNNDVVVTERWLGRLIWWLEQSPETGMVGPMSNAVSGPQLVKNVPYGDSLDAMHKFAHEYSLRNTGRSTEFMRLVGFCLLIKKEVIDIIGNLDENYLCGNFEDDDICLRSFIAGYKNIIAHDVFIHHYGSMTFRGNAIDYSTTIDKNLKYFSNKWKGIVKVSSNEYKVTLRKNQQLSRLLEWGEEKYLQGDIQSSIKIFQRVLHLDKTNSQALNNLGVIQWRLGEVVSSIDTFQKALIINPKDTDALRNLVQAASEIESCDFIKPSLLEVLLKEHPTHPDVLTLMNLLQGRHENDQIKISEVDSLGK